MGQAKHRTLPLSPQKVLIDLFR